MFDFITNTPPETALLLGFFIALSLKRSRISKLLDHYSPVSKSNDVKTPQSDPRDNGK